MTETARRICERSLRQRLRLTGPDEEEMTTCVTVVHGVADDVGEQAHRATPSAEARPTGGHTVRPECA